MSENVTYEAAIVDEDAEIIHEVDDYHVNTFNEYMTRLIFRC